LETGICLPLKTFGKVIEEFLQKWIWFPLTGKKHSGIIGEDGKALISEELCVGCGICIKKCPFDAIDIVSLPEETFKSSDASVKASLVFLKRFTGEDEAAWETAWESAHAKLDAGFNTRRGELCAQHGPVLISAGDAGLAELIKNLSALGIERTLPAWRLKPPPPYPRGVVQTEILKPRWEGTAEGKEAKTKAKKLRAEFESRWTEEVEERAADLLRELRAALRKLDREQGRALWQEVRTGLDYAVFTAAPEEVGITSTGAQGPDQLPDVLAAYRQFEQWLSGGAKEAQRPAFA